MTIRPIANTTLVPKFGNVVHGQTQTHLAKRTRRGDQNRGVQFALNHGYKHKSLVHFGMGPHLWYTSMETAILMVLQKLQKCPKNYKTRVLGHYYNYGRTCRFFRSLIHFDRNCYNYGGVHDHRLLQEGGDEPRPPPLLLYSEQ